MKNNLRSLLYKYLVLYKNVNLPGIGNFAIHQTQATLQFTDKQWQPPVSSIAFTQVAQPTNNHFYTFLSKELKVDKVVAIRLFKEEMETMLQAIETDAGCKLPGMGTLHKRNGDTVGFTALEPQFSFYSILPAERVVRKYAQHTVLVGEHEHLKDYRSPEAEQEILFEEEPAKEKWKTYALIIAILSVLMIVLYYATHTAN